MTGTCELCQRPNVRLVADHDHHTNMVRGFICYQCNVALGKLGDDVPSIERVLRYLTGGTTGVTYREYDRARERESPSHQYAHRVLTNKDYLSKRAAIARRSRRSMA